MELFFSFRLFILMGLLLSLKLTVSPLEHAICHLLKNWMLQTTVALVIQKPSFPDFLATRFSPNSTKLFNPWKCKKSKACFFSLSHRIFYLSNQKTSTRLLDFVSSCLPPSWNTIYLKPGFLSNWKPEVGIMQSFYGRGCLSKTAHSISCEK